jgi:transcriptional regulator with XRE-family HTH domain
MANQLPNHLRAYRRRDGLTQDQLSYLLGGSDATTVSRYERFARKPNLETALACQAIFGVPAHELFPGVYGEAKARVRARARELLARPAGDPRSSISKRTMARLAAAADEQNDAQPHNL